MWNRGVALRVLRNLSRLTRLTECRDPKKGRERHSLGVCYEFHQSCEEAGGSYSPMIPLFNPIIAACVRSLAPNLERMDLTRLLTVSSVILS